MRPLNTNSQLYPFHHPSSWWLGALVTLLVTTPVPCGMVLWTTVLLLDPPLPGHGYCMPSHHRSPCPSYGHAQRTQLGYSPPDYGPPVGPSPQSRAIVYPPHMGLSVPAGPPALLANPITSTGAVAIPRLLRYRLPVFIPCLAIPGPHFATLAAAPNLPVPPSVSLVVSIGRSLCQ